MSIWRKRMAVALSAAALAAPGVVTATAPAHAEATCPTTMGRIACVDLDHQRMWVQDGGRLVLGPLPIRSGGPRTPTRDGLWHIYWRDRHHFSHLYRMPMPFAQFFSGGEAFHAISGRLDTRWGSYGCVNLSYHDARRLWRVLRLHDPVSIWGRRPA